MVKTNTLTVKFRRAGTENEYFLAWTTTPWTLASNTALTVGPDIDYIKEDGTGIVHTAPAFGEDDYQCGRKYGLPVLQPVDERGCYTATPWAGRFVMEEGLDVDIIKYLATENKIFSKEKIEHNYPHCWRCGTPLVYYAKPSWYIEMSKLKDQLVAYCQLVPCVCRRKAFRQLARRSKGLGYFQIQILGHAYSYLEMRVRSS